MITIKQLLEQRGYWKPWEGKIDTKTSKFDGLRLSDPETWGLCFKGNGRGPDTSLSYNGKVIGGIYRAELTQNANDLGKLKLWAHASRIDINDFKGYTKLEITGTGEALKEAGAK